MQGSGVYQSPSEAHTGLPTQTRLESSDDRDEEDDDDDAVRTRTAVTAAGTDRIPVSISPPETPVRLTVYLSCLLGYL